MYKNPKSTDKAALDKMYKVAKTHRSALDLDYKECTQTE